MRKTLEIILLIVTILLFITAFISCRNNESRAQAAAARNLSKGFSCNAQITLSEKTYAARFLKKSSTECSMTFTEPSELATLTFIQSSDSLSIQYGKLSEDVSSSVISQTAIFRAIFGAFSAAAESEAHASFSGNLICISGFTQAGAYSLFLNKSLIPQKLTMTDISLTVLFLNFQYAS